MKISIKKEPRRKSCVDVNGGGGGLQWRAWEGKGMECSNGGR